jgi:ABC-type nitrate/sulfonate/bicarbonate transport system substrate-binding protein
MIRAKLPRRGELVRWLSRPGADPERVVTVRSAAGAGQEWSRMAAGALEVWTIDPLLREPHRHIVEPRGHELLCLVEALDESWLARALRAAGITDGRDRLVTVVPQMELFA